MPNNDNKQPAANDIHNPKATSKKTDRLIANTTDATTITSDNMISVIYTVKAIGKLFKATLGLIETCIKLMEAFYALKVVALALLFAYDIINVIRGKKTLKSLFSFNTLKSLVCFVMTIALLIYPPLALAFIGISCGVSYIIQFIDTAKHKFSFDKTLDLIVSLAFVCAILLCVATPQMAVIGSIIFGIGTVIAYRKKILAGIKLLYKKIKNTKLVKKLTHFCKSKALRAKKVLIDICIKRLENNHNHITSKKPSFREKILSKIFTFLSATLFFLSAGAIAADDNALKSTSSTPQTTLPTRDTFTSRDNLLKDDDEEKPKINNSTNHADKQTEAAKQKSVTNRSVINKTLSEKPAIKTTAVSQVTRTGLTEYSLFNRPAAETTARPLQENPQESPSCCA